LHHVGNLKVGIRLFQQKYDLSFTVFFMRRDLYFYKSESIMHPSCHIGCTCTMMSFLQKKWF